MLIPALEELEREYDKAKRDKEFEKELSQKLGWINPLAVNSGTSALHLALATIGIKMSDEVIIPAQTFIATGLAVLYQKAKPVFADIEAETGNINISKIEKNITPKMRRYLLLY